MDDSDGIILFLVGCLVFGGLAYGIIYGIKKAMNKVNNTTISDDQNLKKVSKQNADEVERQRKQMMDTLKQRQRDYKYRNKFN